MIKPLILAFCVVSGFAVLRPQTPDWQPSPGHTQVPIWPGKAPDAVPIAGPEGTATVQNPGDPPATVVGRVSRPTMTVYSPKGKNTGAAVVVFPGGGYWVLYMDLEGTEVCDWLTSKGITCVLLKYRVPGEHLSPRSGAYPKSPVALEDAQRTVGLVRFHAAEWGIDPHKIGVLGFSAGGHLVAAVSTHFKQRLYRAVDSADKESCRPDFGVALYPGHMLENTSKQFELNPYVPVTSQTPPMFLLQAEDDPIDTVKNSLVYYAALKKVGVPVEMHLYSHGGHGFGLRRTKSPITEWPQLVERWLETIEITSGIVAPRRINSRPVQSMHGRSAMQELSQLLKHRLLRTIVVAARIAVFNVRSRSGAKIGECSDGSLSPDFMAAAHFAGSVSPPTS